MNVSDMWKSSIKVWRLEWSFILGGFGRVEHLFPVTVCHNIYESGHEGIAFFTNSLKGNAGGLARWPKLFKCKQTI